MTISSLRLMFALGLMLLFCLGCHEQPITGGTRGVLTAGGAPLGEIQVTVFASENGSWKLLGFAVAADDGTFELVTPGAQGPLKLTAGEYRCTLESAGAPVQIPPEYIQPDTTPLKITWSPASPLIALETPPLAAIR